MCVELKIAYDARQKALEAIFRAIGCSGATHLERLPYFRCGFTVLCSCCVLSQQTYVRAAFITWHRPSRQYAVGGTCSGHSTYPMPLYMVLLRCSGGFSSGSRRMLQMVALNHHTSSCPVTHEGMARRLQKLKSTGCFSRKLPDVTR
jgi:hypothetical protein